VDIRPAEVAVWMRAHRKWVDMEITNIDLFEARWWAWWKALQPPERADSTSSMMPVPTNDMNWESLQKPGVNGLLLIVVALRWW
ncbi:hypothetical protein FIBSPDRAFT_664539, partial [Athelia psychrophila]